MEELLFLLFVGWVWNRPMPLKIGGEHILKADKPDNDHTPFYDR